MKNLFVAVAQHNTGHGATGTPICVSESIENPLNAARCVERLGYQFYSNDSCVVIYLMEENQTKPKAICDILFIRRFQKNEAWKEEWVDEKYRPEKEKTQAA